MIALGGHLAVFTYQPVVALQHPLMRLQEVLLMGEQALVSRLQLP
jgi:hypothetical protein